MRCNAAVLLGILCFCFKADAQIVNVENARMQSDTVGWLGSAGASLSVIKNTTQIFSIGTEAHVQYKTKNNQSIWLLLGDFNFLKAQNKRFVSDDLFHLRYNKKISKRIRWEAFTQYQNNNIMNVASRFLVGTGPRFKLVELSSFKFYAATLLMLEREKEVATSEILHQDLRNSSYFSFTWFPKDYITMIGTTYIQPKLDKISDYRILNQLLLKIKATKRFSLSLKWNYLFDSFPAGTAPNTSYNFTTGFLVDM